MSDSTEGFPPKLQQKYRVSSAERLAEKIQKGRNYLETILRLSDEEGFLVTFEGPKKTLVIRKKPDCINSHGEKNA